MPRPLRIEFENACYHVMNRSVAGRLVFSSSQCYQAFLDILSEACFRYVFVVHAYCLLPNQYHLLLTTPKGNLSHVMRQVNGVYTQRSNTLNKTDGPLFKGRFKAILLEQGSMQLKLSKFIHCRPAAIKKPVVRHLIDYPWSSYPAYVGNTKPPSWLSQGILFEMLDCEDKFQAYANYVASGDDDDIIQLYGRTHLPGIIGSKSFKTSLPCLVASPQPPAYSGLSMAQIIDGVASFYGITGDELTQVIRGRQKVNLKRKFAMYLCQELTDSTLTQIAHRFNLAGMGSSSHATHHVRQLIKKSSTLQQEMSDLIKYIQRHAG